MQHLNHFILFVFINLETSTSFLSTLALCEYLTFVHHHTGVNVKSSARQRDSSIYMSSTVPAIIDDNDSGENDELHYNEGPLKITSPLKFVGPYPTIPLHFPNLSTSSQRERDISGISLDFLLDTGANTNTINAQVATELSLDSIGTALPGYNTGGTMDGGTTFLLGDCTLDVPEKKKELFMKELSASALPIASPTGAGLLGSAFLNCFQGGVKFNWYGSDSDQSATVVFYGDEDGMDDDISDMTRVPIHKIEDVLLPSVTLIINGKEIPALLDTGSPITVLNAAAANFVELDTIQLPKEDDNNQSNPFKKLADNFKNANALANAASKGDVLMIAGAGGPVQLLRSNDVVDLRLKGDDNDDVSFSENKIYVGDLPGLAALGGLSGISSPPAAVLGMDVLKRKPSMLYRMNEVYF